MRRFLFFVLLPVSLIVPGCEGRPHVPKEDLGEVVFEVPTVPGSEKPYEMPQLAKTDTEKSPRNGEEADGK